MELVIKPDTEVFIGQFWGPSNPAFYIDVGDRPSLLISNYVYSVEQYYKMFQWLKKIAEDIRVHPWGLNGLKLCSHQTVDFTYTNHLNLYDGGIYKTLELDCTGDTEQQVSAKKHRLNKVIKALKTGQGWC